MPHNLAPHAVVKANHHAPFRAMKRLCWSAGVAQALRRQRLQARRLRYNECRRGARAPSTNAGGAPALQKLILPEPGQ